MVNRHVAGHGDPRRSPHSQYHSAPLCLRGRSPGLVVVALFAGMLLLAGCGPRIDKAQSLTVKLREGFSEHHGPYQPEDAFAHRPIRFEYGEWTYTPQERPKAKNTKERLKDEADRVGESIIGQIFVSLAEVVVKGTIELTAAGIQASLDDDEVVVTLGNGIGKISLIAEEGFNRIALTASDKAVLQAPWTLEVWSLKRYRYAFAVTDVPAELFAEQGWIEVLLAKDGTVSINGRVFALQAPAPAGP